LAVTWLAGVILKQGLDCNLLWDLEVDSGNECKSGHTQDHMDAEIVRHIMTRLETKWGEIMALSASVQKLMEVLAYLRCVSSENRAAGEKYAALDEKEAC